MTTFTIAAGNAGGPEKPQNVSYLWLHQFFAEDRVLQVGRGAVDSLEL